MHTYAFGTTPTDAVKDKLREFPHGKYPMELDVDDMLTLLGALASAYAADRYSLRTSILETLGIEEI
jgi:hypothetical protein